MERLAPNDNPNYAPDTYSSTAYEASKAVKASSGIIYGISGYNSKAGAQFIQIFDSATVPADTAVPIFTMTVPTVANFNVDFGTFGLRCGAGIAVSNSSTGPTKTIGSADCFFTVRYK